MDESGFQFRTAAIGGFNKQDVMAYLEHSSRDHAARLAQLQKQLEEARSALSQGDEQSMAQAQRTTTLEAENRRLSGDLADREARLTKAVAELEELRARTSALEAEVARLTPAAAAYEAVRDRAANIELEAHSRAQAIERQSQEKARQSQEQVRAWFERTQDAYEQLRQEMTASVLHAVEELGVTQQTLQKLAGTMKTHDQDLSALKTGIEDVCGVKPPEPFEELW